VVIPETSVYEHVFGELSPADAEWGALVEATTGSAMTYGGLVRRIDAFARVLAAATTINLLNTASDIATTADRLARTTPVHRRSVARESD
jgi:hypothetical protein